MLVRPKPSISLHTYVQFFRAPNSRTQRTGYSKGCCHPNSKKKIIQPLKDDGGTIQNRAAV